MSRPVGSKNKNSYQQDQLPAELLPSEPKQESVIDDTTWQTTVEESQDEIQTLRGEELKMKEMKQVLRTIALSNMTTYTKEGALVAVSMSETEIYLNQLIASGWQLFYVAQLGKNEIAHTIDMLYVFTK